MGCNVFANGNEVACKAGGGKVIASFPDVCLSPPPPPAGPIPIPYPNTSFSKDMKKGSKKVKIDGKPVMLKDQSYYKTSPLGNETATKGQGAGVASHVITGTTYFVAWSMDVKFEGKNVDRHVDFTTSNHNPMENTFVPNPNTAKMNPPVATDYANQTCRNELRNGIHNKQKRAEAKLSKDDNCNQNVNARKLAAQALITCSRLRERRKVQRQVLAARQEMQAKCFNDPSLDHKEMIDPEKPKKKTGEESRATHQTEIANVKQDLINIKIVMTRNNCR